MMLTNFINDKYIFTIYIHRSDIFQLCKFESTQISIEIMVSYVIEGGKVKYVFGPPPLFGEKILELLFLCAKNSPTTFSFSYENPLKKLVKCMNGIISTLYGKSLISTFKEIFLSVLLGQPKNRLLWIAPTPWAIHKGHTK